MKSMDICDECEAELRAAKFRREHPEWLCQCGRIKETTDSPCCRFCWECDQMR